ncbi:hypothetical protein H4219_001974 [Mycoemilia scoparia]|uniref:Uncharacterized protein n=1 Tax=Mycoemilia scoparia TaxID=417184 RepID=A0A9W8DPS0_9FUNG|nr:hypothetical protein H4219_001974 [Mycoemilia scoparia]
MKLVYTTLACALLASSAIAAPAKRGLVQDLLADTNAFVSAPIDVSVIDKAGNAGEGAIPKLLGDIHATVQATPTVTAHVHQRDLGPLNHVLEGLMADVNAPVNVNAHVTPVPGGANLLGSLTAAVHATPTLNVDSHNPLKRDLPLVGNLLGGLLGRRDLGPLQHLLEGLMADVNAPVNVNAHVTPVPGGANLLGSLTAAVHATPTLNVDSHNPLKRDLPLVGNLLGGLLGRRGLLQDLLADTNILASIPADISLVDQAGPNGEGVVPKLVGNLDATVRATPTASIAIHGL